MKNYPFLDLREVNAPFMAELQDAAARVVASGRYVGGEECDAFEHELAAFHGLAKHTAVGCSNGLDALRLIFRAYMELGRLAPGDEVIVPANTYIASILPLTELGLRPVPVEPSVATLNIDSCLVEKAISGRTRAILTVHLYGRAAWDDALSAIAQKHGLIVVEDNAQAIGARAGVAGLNGLDMTGALGHAAAFSFYPTKNLGALGDAGAVMTTDSELAAAVKALANYGSDRRYHNIYKGGNCRLDPIQAAMLRVKLPHVEAESLRRRRLAAIYDETISNPAVVKPEVTPGAVWHQYVVLAENRAQFREYLNHHGVQTDVHYATPPHRQPCYSHEFGDLQLPVTDYISGHCVSLPISACTSDTDAREIAQIINDFRV